MKLQVALDFISSREALKMAKKVSLAVDVIEAGTPLIKAEGLSVVTDLKREFPDKIIVADMKTADVGDLEVEIAAKAGADIVTVMGAGPIETVKSGIEKARVFGNVKVAVDLIGVLDLEEKVKIISAENPDYILVHTGIDEQKSGKDPFFKIKQVRSLTEIPLIVAGGINEELAKKIKEISNIKIVIIGGAITKADDPLKTAFRIKKIISEK